MMRCIYAKAGGGSSSYNLVSRRVVLLSLSPFHLQYTFLPTYLITMADRAPP